MAATQRVTISTQFLSYPSLLRGHGRWFTVNCTQEDNNSNSNPKPTIGIKLRPPLPILVKSAITISGLGFIDAGYSGDWSRIGVISKEVEDLLKAAAFVVIPLCIFVILSISDEHEH